MVVFPPQWPPSRYPDQVEVTIDDVDDTIDSNDIVHVNPRQVLTVMAPVPTDHARRFLEILQELRTSFNSTCMAELGLAQGELLGKLVAKQSATPLSPESIGRMQEMTMQHYKAFASVLKLTEKIVPDLDTIIAQYQAILRGEYPVDADSPASSTAPSTTPATGVAAASTAKKDQSCADFDLVQFAKDPDGYVNGLIAAGLKDPHASNTQKYTYLLSRAPPLFKHFLAHEIDSFADWSAFTKKIRCAFARVATIESIKKERKEVSQFVDCNKIWMLRKVKYRNVCSELNIFSSICTVAQQQVIVDTLAKERVVSIAKCGLQNLKGKLPNTLA
ncbi:hypothetical protein FBU59_000381 [Linderina macrospora]|uniref:Uncharacterized protein n=1 Tax=Linderina macrospora TaxID=4868 RepID=A0ACC1JGZ7_9FUNG|nr:hypothetical protein FBU59_000381 [Linderina macrospora]